MNVSEDILFTILSNLSFDELLEKRKDLAFKTMTEHPTLLHLLSQIHRLPYRNTFDELLEEYDKKYFTSRCLSYHPEAECIAHFIHVGDWDRVEGWDNWYGVLIAASKLGYIDVVKYVLSISGVRSHTLSEAMGEAARNGHVDVVKLLIDYGADDLDWGLHEAASGQHMNLIEFFIDQGADDMNQGLQGTVEAGNKDLIDYFIERGATEFDDALITAVSTGNKDIIEYIASKGVKHSMWDIAVDYEAAKGNLDMVKYLVEKKGAQASDMYIREAMENEHDEVVDYLRGL